MKSNVSLKPQGRFPALRAAVAPAEAGPSDPALPSVRAGRDGSRVAGWPAGASYNPEACGGGTQPGWRGEPGRLRAGPAGGARGRVREQPGAAAALELTRVLMRRRGPGGRGREPGAGRRARARARARLEPGRPGQQAGWQSTSRPARSPRTGDGWAPVPNLILKGALKDQHSYIFVWGEGAGIKQRPLLILQGEDILQWDH